MRRLGPFLLSLLLLAASPARPERIASGSLASDEILVTLLWQTKEIARLVAVSQFATDPRYSNVADRIPEIVSGRVGGELESLLALKPDLAILASYNKPEIEQRLAGAHVKVLRLSEFRSLDDIANNIKAIGAATALEQPAAEMIARFQKGRAAAREAAKKRGTHPTVLDFSADGSVSGKGTLFDALVSEAGGVGLAGQIGLKDWPKLSTEALAVLRPDVLVAVGDPGDKAKVLTEIRSLPGWKEMPAAKAGKVIVIPGRELAAVSPFVLNALDKLNAELPR